jgi:hypothetical protein
MKKTFALMLSLVCSISFVAAQAPAPEAAAPARPAAQQPAAPAAQASAASKVTYVGCLKPGTAADSWVLENAEVSAAGAESKPAATAGASSSKLTVALTAKPGENLKPHANHKIEVTGTAGPAASASATTSSPAGGGATATAATKQNLNVESFKMVSATCP